MNTALAIILIAGLAVLLVLIGRGMLAPKETDATLDHVAVEAPAVDWRIAKLVQAHQKYGRDFVAGPKGMGEVMTIINGKLEVSKPVVDNVRVLRK